MTQNMKIYVVCQFTLTLIPTTFLNLRLKETFEIEIIKHKHFISQFYL